MEHFAVCSNEFILLCIALLFSEKFTYKFVRSSKVCVILADTSGVAYSKHIVHIYSYHGGDDLRNHLEVCLSKVHKFSMTSLFVYKAIAIPFSYLSIH